MIFYQLLIILLKLDLMKRNHDISNETLGVVNEFI